MFSSPVTAAMAERTPDVTPKPENPTVAGIKLKNRAKSIMRDTSQQTKPTTPETLVKKS